MIKVERFGSHPTLQVIPSQLSLRSVSIIDGGLVLSVVCLCIYSFLSYLMRRKIYLPALSRMIPTTNIFQFLSLLSLALPSWGLPQAFDPPQDREILLARVRGRQYPNIPNYSSGDRSSLSVSAASTGYSPIKVPRPSGYQPYSGINPQREYITSKTASSPSSAQPNAPGRPPVPSLPALEPV